METKGESDRVVYLGGLFSFNFNNVKGLKSYCKNVVTRISNLSFINEHTKRRVSEIMKTQKIANPEKLALGDTIYDTRIWSYYSEKDSHLENMIKNKKIHIDSYLSSVNRYISDKLEEKGFLSKNDEDYVHERSTIWDLNCNVLKNNSVFDMGSKLERIFLEVKDPVYFYRDFASKVVSKIPYKQFQIICAIGFQGEEKSRPVYAEDSFRISMLKNKGLTEEERDFLYFGSELFCHDSYGHASDFLLTRPMDKIPEEFESFLFTIGSITEDMSLRDFEATCGPDHFIRNMNQINHTHGEDELYSNVRPNCTIIYVMIYGISVPIVIAMRDIQVDEELVFDSNAVSKEKEDGLVRFYERIVAFQSKKCDSREESEEESDEGEMVGCSKIYSEVGTQVDQDHMEYVCSVVKSTIMETVSAGMDTVISRLLNKEPDCLHPPSKKLRVYESAPS